MCVGEYLSQLKMKLGTDLSLTAPSTYLVYSYKHEHDDGRVSYPLCFVFYSPDGKALCWCCTCGHGTKPNLTMQLPNFFFHLTV